MGTKTYGQYCGLAKALDHVGDRWTLLIIRELLIGPRRYTSLRSALPGIATNLLADRLDDLESDGLARRSDDGNYELTPAGRDLKPAIEALVRFGGRWMTERKSSEIFRPQWLVVALRSLLGGEWHGVLQLEVEGESIWMHDGAVGLGEVENPHATVAGRAENVLAVAAGMAPLSALRVHGERRVAATVLTP